MNDMIKSTEIVNGNPTTIWRWKVMDNHVRDAYELELNNASLQLDELHNVMNMLVKYKSVHRNSRMTRIVKSIRLIGKQITDLNTQIAELEQILKDDDLARGIKND